MAAKKRKTQSPKSANGATQRAMKAAMDDSVTRDLARHATEQCIRAVHASQQLADTEAARILIALECAAAVLLYQSAQLKHIGQLAMPLRDVLNQITHDMLAMIDNSRIEAGEAMLIKAAKRE